MYNLPTMTLFAIGIAHFRIVCWSFTVTPNKKRQKLVSRFTLPAFDFSAPSEWESFYQETIDTVEWHSSVPLERVASYVPNPNADILMVGCGNSKLPETILSCCQNPKIVLLDSSPTCLDQLMKLYGSDMKYVCGDAIKLERFFPEERFDIIVDKGLSDAIFCSEGWNGPLEKLYQGAANILHPGTGKYLLISYKLSSSTKEFLRQVGDDVGLEWEFDLKEDSNNRVGVSLATKRQ